MIDRIVVGEDMRGNLIVYQNNHDGTWTNLVSEIAYPDEFVERHFSRLLHPEYHDPEQKSELFEGNDDGKSGETTVFLSCISHRDGPAVDLQSLVTA